MAWTWPWQTRDPESGVLLDTENRLIYGPYLPPNWDSGEFGVLQPVANVVTNVTKNINRITTAAAKDPVQQEQAGPAWWNLFGRAAQSTADFTQSTLTKVIIIVVVAAVGSLFIMSYVQARGASLAK